MVAWWWLVIVGLVMFWLGYVVCALLLNAVREADEWDRQFREKYPDWPDRLSGENK